MAKTGSDFKKRSLAFLRMLRSARRRGARLAMCLVCGVLCVSMFTGCVGGFVVAESRIGKSYDAPNLELKDDPGYATSGKSPTPTNITKQELIAKWGEPYRIEVQAPIPEMPFYKRETEQLFYRREIGFSGLLVFVLIPIPLVVPVSRPSVAEFQEGTLVRVEMMYGDWVAGGVCGIVMWDGGVGPGCLNE